MASGKERGHNETGLINSDTQDVGVIRLQGRNASGCDRASSISRIW